MKQIFKHLAFGAALAASLGMLLAGCGGDDDPVCFGADRTYAIGETYDEGCRACTCNDDTSITCLATAACTTGCEDAEGNLQDVGAFWPAGDGCNICQCVSAGETSCTTNACGVPCAYAGQQKAPGTSFPSIDGCNTCECQSDGTVSCTELACTCDAAAEWWRDYVATSTAECAVIDYSCPDNTTGFENSCGCGCEQSSACAESYNCTPPNNCNVPQIMIDCPYSEILE